MPFLRFPAPIDFLKFLRQLEHDMETVINVLQPGPLGIVEHKFSATELHAAKATVARAVSNWQRNHAMERAVHGLKEDNHKDNNSGNV